MKRPGQYHFKRVLGYGASGTVYEVTLRDTQKVSLFKLSSVATDATFTSVSERPSNASSYGMTLGFAKQPNRKPNFIPIFNTAASWPSSAPMRQKKSSTWPWNFARRGPYTRCFSAARS